MEDGLEGQKQGGGAVSMVYVLGVGRVEKALIKAAIS